MIWTENWGHWGKLTVIPVAVKGSRPELQAQSVQGRLEVEEFPSRRECVRERKSRLVSASKSSTLFFHKGEIMAWFACHPNHTIWREIVACVCPHMCVWNHLVSKINPTVCTHTQTCTQAFAHHSISHLNKCAIMLGAVKGRQGAAQQFKNQHLTYSATESKLLRKSCTYHGQSNTNNSSASA